jgi:hypothetical protein
MSGYSRPSALFFILNTGLFTAQSLLSKIIHEPNVSLLGDIILFSSLFFIEEIEI